MLFQVDLALRLVPRESHLQSVYTTDSGRKTQVFPLTLAISGRSLTRTARRERRMLSRARDEPHMPYHGPLHRVVSWLFAILHEAHAAGFSQAAQLPA